MLEGQGVKIVALCTDTPGQVQAGRHKHGLQALMLSDRDLVVTDKFGLRNMNTAVRPPGIAALPVPTTLMVDERGIVRWKDQSEDYQQRSDPDAVKAGLALVKVAG